MRWILFGTVGTGLSKKGIITLEVALLPPLLRVEHLQCMHPVLNGVLVLVVWVVGAVGDAPDALGVLNQVIGFRVLVQLGLDSSQFDGSKGDHGMVRWADDLPVVQPQLSKPLGNFPIFGSCGWVEEMDWSILSPTRSDH